MGGTIFLLLSFCVINIVCQSDDQCKASTCGECISKAENECIWCAQEKPMDRRCIPSSDLNATAEWCAKGFIKVSKPEKNVIIDNPFNDTVLMRPQRMRIKARPGHKTTFTVKFQPAKDYPLDVYYLMDISYTMKVHKEALQDQAQEIYHQLNSYTNNVQLGIGSFVEKPGFPLVDLHKNPPHKAHSFRNHLSLTNNMTNFKAIMKEIEFGGNYDWPEAGLDGLMQAMTCKDELKWRPNAMRMIVLCTDSTYHSAGDGRVVGAILPNDMQCHLDNDLYNETMALTYDYPSVSQINKVATEGNFIIVFAGKTDVSTEYTRLASQIVGARYASLERRSDAVEIIKRTYIEQALRVELYYKVLREPENIQLIFDQNCKGKPYTNCQSNSENRTVEINATLTIRQCPFSGLPNEVVVKTVNFIDNITIELDVDCKCDCELGLPAPSPKCNMVGVSQCGICVCNPGSYGDKCQCNGTSVETKEDMEKCKLNPNDHLLCSGKGTCRCGTCDCKKDFSGEFCQFDDLNSCPRVNSQLCSGNGKCHLGRCQCYKDWTREDCSCTTIDKKCIAPYSKQLCSGNGICECGSCKCSNISGTNVTYSGSFCDVCDGCERCKELEDYVECNVLNEKDVCDKKYDPQNTILTFLNRTQFNGIEWYSAILCQKQLENSSIINFKYRYIGDNIELGIQNEVESPPKANLFIAMATSIGLVLLLGILTIIVWKILVDLHDKREFQKFSDASKAQGYDVSENPLYTPPAVNFSNPAYSGCN